MGCSHISWPYQFPLAGDGVISGELFGVQEYAYVAFYIFFLSAISITVAYVFGSP
jgi:hypothetical protein